MICVQSYNISMPNTLVPCGRELNFNLSDAKVRNSSEGYSSKISPLSVISCHLLPPLGRREYSCQLPSGNRNYTIFDQNKVDCFVSQKENALPYLADILANSNNEVQIVETLYIINQMLDNGVKGVDKIYPVLARFNNATSPNIQTFLAGIYRKTQIPDAFGPLVKMLIQNSMHPQVSNFDPNEEIGGAILAYLSNRFGKNAT